MTEQQTTSGATTEGASVPSQPSVATSGAQQPTQAPDLSSIDLSTLPQFREYDSKLQKRLAATERERGELAARVQQAELTRTQDNLRAQGLDERAITQTTAPIMSRIVELETDNILLRLGMTREDIEPGDVGRSAQEFEGNMKRKKTLREEQAALAEERKELARLKQEAAVSGRESERAERRQSGADRQPAGENEPPPELDAKWRAEVKAAMARGEDVALVNRKYRKQGLNI